MDKECLTNIETPALLLDIDQMEENISDIIRYSKQNKVAYRPHIKTHKSVQIAKRQVELGAVGITVAKVSEAEVMAAGGMKDILIAYPIAVKSKLKRIKKLMERTSVILTIDSIEQATIVNDFFAEHEKQLTVWIKVNAGLDRCGVEANEEIVALAEHIKQLPALVLTGVFTHAGHSYAATTEAEIDLIAEEEAYAVLKSAELCERVGIPIAHRSIGSTPTFRKAGKMKGITEIRPGNAVFYDHIQVGLGVAERDQCALTVLSTIVSKKSNRIVMDAGSKTLALDQGAHGNKSVQGHGFIKEYPNLIIERLSEEHGVVPIDQEIVVDLNERLTIIPNHACTVVNLFDTYMVHQNGKIIDRWNVDARGRID